MAMRRKFIECYTTAIEEVDSKIDRLPRGSLKGRRLNVSSWAKYSHLYDETGRLVLSPKLRERFFIEKEAYFIAAGDTFKWEPRDI